MEAAKRFFKQAVEVVGHAPQRVTTDGHDSYPRAIRETLGCDVIHRCNPYLNNRVEQDHRGIKQRYYPMRGFGRFSSAARFCRAFDEVRQFFRFRTTMNQSVPLAQQRELCAPTTGSLEDSCSDGLVPGVGGQEVPTHFLAFCVLSSDASIRQASKFQTKIWPPSTSRESLFMGIGTIPFTRTCDLTEKMRGDSNGLALSAPFQLLSTGNHKCAPSFCSS